LSSSCPNELFDTFGQALEYKIDSIDTFKALLANPTLSPDEIKMYTEKLLAVLPQSAYDLCMWTATIFENLKNDFEYIEDAIKYYSRAIKNQPESNIPILLLLKLYNYDYNLPTNQYIINEIKRNINSVKSKSRVYFALADHYRKCGDTGLEARYVALAISESELERKGKL
jgi:tetratricopeptide (TPR) repeat protein